MIKINFRKFLNDHLVFGLYHYEGEWVPHGDTFAPVMKRRFCWAFVKQGIKRLK